MIRHCAEADLPVIEEIVNDAARVYRGVIPDDCWHEPYMSRDGLIREISSGVRFSGWDALGELAGVMGVQDVRDVTLVRHAYVRPSHQGRGAGGMLLSHLTRSTTKPVLVGTWAAAHWAIRFYQARGFRLVDSVGERDRLLRTYWSIPDRQREESVVLTRAG
jgi:GNAT superfamily N-acetyltransferase